ncbi:hypothetical protein [Glaciibacter psychrotolerans]|uniref:Uncharacterized protein n=1 Tax=Glaciibacter psychrotolerans TaxID=670054 RepID=A0A7Z0J741_9MICO|nr:hypothetical protein [Leifsonia psychrotolerans]NYJ21217.1 hypothetical protein [Leifsonia psychrotolerans]
MTLTHILPTLRRSIPDPIDLDLWPELTRASTTDITVSGISLMHVVDLCGTPCVHTAAAVIPGTRGRPSATERATAVVVGVKSVERTTDGTLRIRIDATLGAGVVLSEARLIGRASTARVAPARLMEGAAGDVALPHGVPSDLVAGDLVALPFRGAVTLGAVRPFTAPDHVPTSTGWLLDERRLALLE